MYSLIRKLFTQGLTHKLNYYIFAKNYFHSKYYYGHLMTLHDAKGKRHSPPDITTATGALARFRSRLWRAQRVPQGRRAHRCLAKEHGALDFPI